MKMTAQLRSLLESYKKSLAPDQYQSFEKEVLCQIQLYLQKFTQLSAGVLRGIEIHRCLDIEIEKASNIKTSCQKGCGYCCHLEIEITLDDAEVLTEAITKQNIQIDMERLEKLQLRERQSIEWKQRDVPQNRCLLLGADNACRAYQSRPMVCRKHSVVSLPDECMKPNGSPIPRQIPMAEIIMSAAINLDNNPYAPFAKMLKNTLNIQTEKTRDAVSNVHKLNFKETIEGNELSTELDNF